MRTLKQILDQIPNEKRFEIRMAADSTTEVWTDLSTGLMEDHAWWMLGWTWMIENVDPTIPSSAWPNTNAVNAYQLQLQRNLDSEIMLQFNDDEAMFTDKFVVDVLGAAAGLSFDAPMVHFPQARPIIATRKMRLMFRTETDDAAISADTFALRGKLFYHDILANEQDYVKHGHILRL